MNDIAAKYACPPAERSGIGRKLLGIISALALAISWLAVMPPPTASAAELSAVTVYGPSARTISTLSVRFDRVVESAGICQADIGYEFNSGSGWADAGTFSGNACDNPDPGYKFRNLASGTTYELSVRAYRVVDGAKVDFSQPSTLTATTLGDPAPDPTPTPTPDPTSEPTADPTAEPTATPTGDPSGLSAPALYGPTNQTLSTISVRFDRVAESNGACRADVGYEFSSGSGWNDAGTFSGSACDNADPGYKFRNLASGTTYEVSIRAYLLVDGVKAEYSPASSVTGTTLGDPGPEPTPTPTPTADPTAEPSPTPTGDPVIISAPPMRGPVNRTTTTISIVVDRSAESNGVCTPDIGYEFLGGAFIDWYDHGGFPTAPCDDPDPGFKFSGLQPGTEYVLSTRAYRIIDGVRYYSTVNSLTISTLGDPTPEPTAEPTADPTPDPTASPTPTGDPSGLSAPQFYGPTNRTTSTLSTRFDRVVQSNGTCRADIGYEFSSGAGWVDAGTFSGSACDNADPGYKFKNLASGTTYEVSIRAYLVVDGVKAEYSPVSSLTGTTLGNPVPDPTPTPTPTGDPTAEPTASPSPTPTGDPVIISAPPMRGPVNQTTTTISIVVDRSAESNGVCQPDIGYEFRGGAFIDWYDHGGFPTAPCDDPDPGFKFSGLQPGTEYVLSTRAYRIIDGVRHYSAVNSLTISTLPLEPVAPESAPAPTAEPPAVQETNPAPAQTSQPSVDPALEPSVDPTPEPSVEPTQEAPVQPTSEPTPPLPQPTSAVTSEAPVEPSAPTEPTTVPDPTPKPANSPSAPPQTAPAPTVTPSLEPENTPSPAAGE